MSDPAYLTAHFILAGDTVHADFSLTLDHPVHEVWAMLTAPAGLAKWLAPGEIDTKPGGAVRLDFGESGSVIDSTLTAFMPGRLLEYSWSVPGEPPRPLRWTLEPIGPTTRLTLRVSTPANGDPGRAAAGWAAHLEMLQTALIGAPSKFPFEVFKVARDAFRDQVGQLYRQSRKAEILKMI